MRWKGLAIIRSNVPPAGGSQRNRLVKTPRREEAKGEIQKFVTPGTTGGVQLGHTAATTTYVRGAGPALTKRCSVRFIRPPAQLQRAAIRRSKRNVDSCHIVQYVTWRPINH